MATSFRFATAPQQVVFGTGELDNLGRHLALTGTLGGRPALLCTSRTYARNGVVERVRASLQAELNDWSVTVFDDVQPHVPISSVAAAVELGRESNVMLVIGLGGGSVIGTAKASAAALDGRLSPPKPVSTFGPATHRTRVQVVAIPTTYAGSEMTPVFGITDPEKGKVTMTDPQVLPALVVYDPALTLDLPHYLTAGTGINALAHCVEGAYSTTGSPVSTATALAGIARIAAALPRLLDDGHDLEARAEMLAGAHLGGVTIAHAGLAVHHGLCHVLGGSAGVPHGVANAIVLPHAMRFNLSACAPQLAAVARALGVETRGLSDEAAAGAAVARVETLIERLGLPRRLRDAGVDAGALPRLAERALHSAAVRANPRLVTSAAEIEGILRAAW